MTKNNSNNKSHSNGNRRGGGGNRGNNRNNGRFQGKNKGNNSRGQNNTGAPPSKKYYFHPNGAEDHGFHTFEDTKSYMLVALGRDDAFNTPYEVLESVKDMADKGPVEPTVFRDPKDGKYYRDDTKAVELNEMDLKFHLHEKGIYDKQKVLFTNTSRAVAAQIFSRYCTNDMKDHLRDVKDFGTKVQYDPVLLMEAIRKIHYQGTTTQHPWKVFVEMEQRALQPKHVDGESIDEYLRRHTSDYDEYTGRIGYGYLDAYIKSNDEDYKALVAKGSNQRHPQGCLMLKRVQHQVHCALSGIPDGSTETSRRIWRLPMRCRAIPTTTRAHHWSFESL